MQRIIFFFAILASCQAGPQNEVAVKKKPAPPEEAKKKLSSKSTFEISTMQSANGWSYQIRQNGKLLVDQPTIPGRSGTAGFQRQEDAQKGSRISKIKISSEGLSAKY